MSQPALLEAQGLVKAYGGLKAVQDFDLNVYPGELVGLIGPNGAGKTTTFKLLSGFERPTAGRIFFRGEEITNLSPPTVAAKGLIRTFQRTSVFPKLTLLQSVLLGSHRTLHRPGGKLLLGAGARQQAELEAEAVRLLGLFGLADMAHLTASQLSYGDQRNLALATVLMAKPTMLLLDEPAAGMSTEEATRLAQTVRQIRDSGVTVLMVDHNVRLMMGICDRVVVMHHGAKLSEGAPEEVQRDPEVWRVYLGKHVAQPAGGT